MTVVTRFAPSPTGFCTSAACAPRFSAGCSAKARRQVHPARRGHRPRALDRGGGAAILDGMQWLGLDADEGPYFQTQRFDRYREVIAQMLERGHAYHCYCTKEELDEMRAQQTARKEKPRYDGRWRRNAHGAARRACSPSCASRIRSTARSSSRTSCTAAIDVPERRARRSHHRALRRHARPTTSASSSTTWTWTSRT